MSERAGPPRLRRAPAPLALLTPLGRAALAPAAAAMLAGVWWNWHELVLVGVAIVALIGVGILWQLVPGTLSAELDLRPRLVVEGAASPTMTVRVQGATLPMLSPKVSVPVGREVVSLRLPHLAPFGRHSESVQLPPMPRGAHRVGPVTHEKSDPVGLVARRIPSGPGTELLVAPRTVELSVLAGGLTNDLDGATSQQLSMSDLAFHALREYVPGDDLRHVHWRSSAKAGELLVRQYHETRRGHVTVLLDGARSSYPSPLDFELAVSAATSVALRAVRDELDTYFRCGPHLARGRNAETTYGIACHFDLGDDDYLSGAAAAAGTVTGTGLVVQVTGASRPGVQLDAVGRRFDHGAGWLVVRAETHGQPGIADSARWREITVSDLDQLPDLVARSMR